MTEHSRSPRFTVVVPALDEAARLRRTLESLRRQDFRGGVEVVAVNGVCAARQRGTEAARGEVVVSADADTVHRPNWLSRIDHQLNRHPDAVAVAGPCTYASPPWWVRLTSRWWFKGIAATYAHTGRVLYLTATNLAFYRNGFAGYDAGLTQGGDEMDLLRRLRRWGPVVWDEDNGLTTSSRRLDQGLVYTLLISFGYYSLGGVLNRLTSRSVVAPPVRPERSESRRRR